MDLHTEGACDQMQEDNQATDETGGKHAPRLTGNTFSLAHTVDYMSHNSLALMPFACHVISLCVFTGQNYFPLQCYSWGVWMSTKTSCFVCFLVQCLFLIKNPFWNLCYELILCFSSFQCITVTWLIFTFRFVRIVGMNLLPWLVFTDQLVSDFCLFNLLKSFVFPFVYGAWSTISGFPSVCQLPDRLVKIQSDI